MASTVENRSHGRSPWREAFEAVVGRPSASGECSVSISRNAKGVAQFEVVARSGSVIAASDHAQAEFDALCAKYPYPETVA